MNDMLPESRTAASDTVTTIGSRQTIARKRCSSCAMRRRCLPAGLDADQIARFEANVQRFRTLAPGEHLFRVGDPFQCLFAVHSGCFKSYSVDHEGREHVNSFFFGGEVIGGDAIFPGQHGCNAVALGDSTVCYLPFRALSQLAQEMPELQAQMFRLLSRDVFSMTTITGDFTAEERLAGFLVMVAARHPDGMDGVKELDLAMSRQDIANYLRLATETVSRILARFQKSGLLKAYRRHITLLDFAGLYEIAECMNPYARCGSRRTESRPQAGGGRS